MGTNEREKRMPHNPGWAEAHATVSTQKRVNPKPKRRQGEPEIPIAVSGGPERSREDKEKQCAIERVQK